MRRQAVLLALHASFLALVAIVFVPWKTPAANVALLAYAALDVAAGAGLWRGARWGWRLGVAGGLVGLAGGVLVVGGLLASWAYLRAVYGDFGYGASFFALLIAAVAFGVLGLFPAFLLRALFRERGRFGGGRAGPTAVAILLALPLPVAAWLGLRYRLDPVAPLPAEAREQTIAVLRAALSGAQRPAAPALIGAPLGAGPLYVTLWNEGEVVARASGEGRDLAEAVDQAAASLVSAPRLNGRRQAGGTLRVDRVAAMAPVLSDWPPILALSVDPGRDGLVRIGDGAERVLLPDDLVRRDRFGNVPILPGLRELRLGLDARWALDRLGGGGHLERLRTEGWVEHDGRALPVDRADTPGPDPTPDALRAAAIAGGDFILRQIQPDGRFRYRYFAFDGAQPLDDREYAIPRHAGTVYSLALLTRFTGEARFREGAEKAAAWLVARIAQCGSADVACVAEGGHADLGSSALTLVAMLEYQRSTGDERYAPVARRLAAFLRSMQRPDGEFHHDFVLRTGRPDPRPREMFYSEEAALALVMAHRVLGEEIGAAERALDYLTGPKYAYFLGRFTYGADAWTCVAADEAWPDLQKPAYLDFCLGYARFLQRIQYDDAGRAGHYGFGSLMVPQAPAAAGFSEATISTWLLSREHGAPADDVRAQTRAALGALLHDQVRDDNAWLMRDPAAARGAFRRSVVQQEARIDFTQHAVSALIRGSGAALD